MILIETLKSLEKNKVNGKHLIQGESREKLEQSLVVVRNSVNTVDFNSQSFN